MNQNAKAFVSLIVAAVIILLVSLAAYYIGSEYLANSILEEFKMANPDKNFYNLKEIWETNYFNLVLNMGIIAGAILLLWTALTYWALNTSSSTGVGKRWLWMLLGLILAGVCVVFPTVYQQLHNYTLPTGVSIPVLFVVCYCLVGYWFGSIIVTSDRYKYTPLLARFFKGG